MAANAWEQVDSVFTRAESFQTTALDKLADFTTALNTISYTPPTLTVTWNTLAAPTFVAAPTAPVLSVPTIGVVAAPDTLDETLPDVSITSFSGTFTPRDVTAPSITYGTAPTVPTVATVTIPTAPVVDLPDAPALLTLSTVAFTGVDMHESWLTKLENIPDLVIAEPTAFTHSVNPEYTSALLDAVRTRLVSRLSGGSGLDPAVEQAIWDRSRDRETKTALANEDSIYRTAEGLGNLLPTGAMTAQLREAQQAYFGKLSDLSRDVMVKQAELEQANLKDAINSGIQLESQLVDLAYKMQQLTFETAKEYAANAVQIYNAGVEHYKVLLEGYKTYASAYQTVIQAELSKVEVFKGLLQAESVKADANRTLIEGYKAEIQARMSGVEIYKAQVDAAKVLVQIEGEKINAAKESISAFTATINAETAKVEAYKASVSAEVSRANVFETQVRAYSAYANTQAEISRAHVARYSAMVQAKSAEWSGYSARIEAEKSKVQAITANNTTLIDAYRAAAYQATATTEAHTKVWEANMKQYEAGKTLTLNAAKVNADQLHAAKTLQADVAKTGTQVYAQLTASAYSMMHAQAGITGNTQMQNAVSYQYSGAVTTGVSPVVLL